VTGIAESRVEWQNEAIPAKALKRTIQVNAVRTSAVVRPVKSEIKASNVGVPNLVPERKTLNWSMAGSPPLVPLE